MDGPPAAASLPCTMTWTLSISRESRMRVLWVMTSRDPPTVSLYLSIPADTVRTASTSSPESVSSRMARSGFSISSCSTSAFFFSPPEKPTLSSLSR